MGGSCMSFGSTDRLYKRLCHMMHAANMLNTRVHIGFTCSMCLIESSLSEKQRGSQLYNTMNPS